MNPDVLLLVGVATSVLFVVVVFVEGAFRPGYELGYHTGSELSLGERGWVQFANFLQFGAGMLAFAAGVNRVLDTPVGSILLALFGLGAVLAGVFRPDPVRGYPPGASTGNSAELTRSAKIHNLTGPVMFFAVFGACIALAGRLDDPWRLYTVLTAVAGLALTIWTAVAFQRDAVNTGFVQRGLILVYFSWIALIGLHLVNTQT